MCFICCLSVFPDIGHITAALGILAEVLDFAVDYGAVKHFPDAFPASMQLAIELRETVDLWTPPTTEFDLEKYRASWYELLRVATSGVFECPKKMVDEVKRTCGGDELFGMIISVLRHDLSLALGDSDKKSMEAIFELIG